MERSFTAKPIAAMVSIVSLMVLLLSLPRSCQRSHPAVPITWHRITSRVRSESGGYRRHPRACVNCSQTLETPCPTKARTPSRRPAVGECAIRFVGRAIMHRQSDYNHSSANKNSHITTGMSHFQQIPPLAARCGRCSRKQIARTDSRSRAHSRN